ncbi:MAG TPA: hypothetical protein DDX06_07915 [Curvibacter sp.]|nr:hypothetical protein [Curvibacter sp.]
MQRRTVMGLALLPALLPLAHAHHGWSSFDQDRPIYLQGRVQSVRWQNPHAELVLEVPPGLGLPADLAQRPLPAQSAPVDGKALLAKAQLPRRQDRRWEIELAPLSRMQAWNVTPLKVGDEIAVLGFTFQDEKGAAILRAEYLFVGSQVYGLRSSPA